MSSRLIALVVVGLATVNTLAVHDGTAVQRQRVVVKGAVDANGFSDKGLDESAKHIRERLMIVSLFTAAKSEEQADLLVVVSQRSDDHGEKSITAYVSTKTGAEWTPAIKITEVCNCAWTLTAEKVIRAMAKWAKDRK